MVVTFNTMVKKNIQAKTIKTDLHPFEFIASHSGVSSEHIQLEQNTYVLIKEPPSDGYEKLTKMTHFSLKGKHTEALS